MIIQNGTPQLPVPPATWPPGSAETARLIRLKDWSTHPLGPPPAWPIPLRTAVDLVLACHFPMIVLWGKNLVQIYNDAYLALMGSKHPAGMGQPTQQCWPEVWHINLPVYTRIWQGETLTFEDQLFPILRHDFLEDAYFTLCYSPLKDDTGTIAGILVTVFETTQRLLASRARDLQEAALGASEERLRFALSAANGVGIWDWDVQRDLFYSEPSLALVYGVDPDLAATGAPLSDYAKNIHPDDWAHVERAVTQSMRTGEEYAEEYRLIQSDGSICWVAARGRCSLTPEGTPLRFSGVTTDISERKLIEETLRTTEKLAAVGRLASSIAHEINNPLEAVMNLLYLMETTADQQELRAYLALAQQELARVAQITTHTLRFHRQSVRPTNVQMSDLIESILVLYQGRLLNSGITVERRFRQEAPVLCNGDDLRQVFNNLIANAYDAMRDGDRRRLIVRTHLATNWQSGKKGIRITIADSGKGIAPATRSKLFEPFFTTKGIKGTGLGLWVSMGIVTKHEGSMTVRTSQKESNSGTVFSVFIPDLTSDPSDDPINDLVSVEE